MVHVFDSHTDMFTPKNILRVYLFNIKNETYSGQSLFLDQIRLRKFRAKPPFKRGLFTFSSKVSLEIRPDIVIDYLVYRI